MQTRGLNITNLTSLFTLVGMLPMLVGIVCSVQRISRHLSLLLTLMLALPVCSQVPGTVTTLAGGNAAGLADGIRTAARFNYPNGVSLDSTGNIAVVVS